jgi:hypothetical protein
MSSKKDQIIVENGQESDLADSRESSEREPEIRKLAKRLSYSSAPTPCGFLCAIVGNSSAPRHAAACEVCNFEVCVLDESAQCPYYESRELRTAMASSSARIKR